MTLKNSLPHVTIGDISGMQFLQREPLQKVRRREFSGFHEGEPLVVWLNEKPKSKPRQRIIVIIHLLRDQVRVVRQGGFNPKTGKINFAFPPRNITRRIRRLLSRYRFVPNIRLTWKGTLLDAFPWQLKSMTDPYNEQKAIWALIRLAQYGRILAVNECVGCGKWFFGPRLDSATCGTTTCLQRKVRAEMTEERRDEIRRKRRQRYHRLKE